jgi:hypothetical protein
MFLALDPGIRGAGCALFDEAGAELRAAAYVRNPKRSGNGPAECVALAQAVDEWLGKAVVNLRIGNLDEVVVEWPQIYTAGKQIGDPNDLLALVGVDAAVCALASCGRPVRLTHYLPRAWKGQLPKGEVFETRVLDRLVGTEVFRLDTALAQTPASLRHNVYDAVGLGLAHTGRFDRKRVFPR